MAVPARRRPRSGSHLVKRGEIYHYRRAVPPDVRAAFDGKSEVTRSLATSNEVEARRLEKKLDVEFEERLHGERDAANPDTRRARIAKDILEAAPRNKVAAQWGVAYVPAADREAVRSLVMPNFEAQDEHRAEIARLVYEIEQALPRTPLDPETWEKCRSGILNVVRHHVANLTATAAPLAVSATEGDLPTLEWAFGRWLRKRAGRRKDDSVDRARSHLSEFVAETGLVMLADVRRSHLLRWRDKLVDAGALAKGSINLRLQFVGAILRAGWRDAEMPEQNFRDIILLTDDQKQRVTWSRTEIIDSGTKLDAKSPSRPASFTVEDIAACQEEDVRRATMLRKEMHRLVRAMPDCDPEEVAHLLEHNADPHRFKPLRSCLASSVYLRARRLGVLGAVLDLISAHSKVNRRWIVASSPEMYFDWGEHFSDPPARARRLFEYELESSSAAEVGGFVVAFANGYFDIVERKFRLEYRGIAAGDKLKKLCAASQSSRQVPTDDRMRVTTHAIKDLQTEILRLLPNSLRERGPSPPGNASLQRMREPYHSAYLLWLAQNNLADLMVIDGAFYWNGGLKLRECYGEPLTWPAVD